VAGLATSAAVDVAAVKAHLIMIETWNRASYPLWLVQICFDLRLIVQNDAQQ
jgi:hypothetical protein